MIRSLLLFAGLSLVLPVVQIKSQAAEVQTLQQKETSVYITKTGEKYHREGCRYLSRSKIKVSKADALKNGYGACKVCKP